MHAIWFQALFDMHAIWFQALADMHAICFQALSRVKMNYVDQLAKFWYLQVGLPDWCQALCQNCWSNLYHTIVLTQLSQPL